MIIREKIRRVIDAASSSRARSEYIIHGERITRVKEVVRRAQHPKHQLFREAITERAFAFAFEYPMMERFYDESMRMQS